MTWPLPFLPQELFLHVRTSIFPRQVDKRRDTLMLMKKMSRNALWEEGFDFFRERLGGGTVLFIVRPEHQANIASTAIKNYGLVKIAFFAELNGLGARAEVVSKTPRHVMLGSCVLKKVDPLRLRKSRRIQGERFLGRGTIRGALRPRLGLAWPGWPSCPSFALVRRHYLTNGIMWSSMYIKIVSPCWEVVDGQEMRSKPIGGWCSGREEGAAAAPTNDEV